MKKKNLLKRIEQLEKENELLERQVELWKKLADSAKKIPYYPYPYPTQPPAPPHDGWKIAPNSAKPIIWSDMVTICK